jgi:hypothetical protein
MAMVSWLALILLAGLVLGLIVIVAAVIIVLSTTRRK